MINKKKNKILICTATIAVVLVSGVFVTNGFINQPIAKTLVEEENIEQSVLNTTEEESVEVSNSFDTSIPKYYEVEESKIDLQNIEDFYIEDIEVLETDVDSSSLFNEDNKVDENISFEVVESKEIVETEKIEEVKDIEKDEKIEEIKKENNLSELKNLETEVTAKESTSSVQTTNNKKEYKFYTYEDVIVLAKMVWGEARGVPSFTTKDGRTISSKAQQAATIWCVLNRFDAGYAKTITAVVTAPNQFHGYKASFPATDEFIALAEDVLERWAAEKEGQENVGRTLPKDYLYFAGKNGYNYFRNQYRGTSERWDWELGDPYQ